MVSKTTMNLIWVILHEQTCLDVGISCGINEKVIGPV